ncbi:MAG: ribonuclease Y [bacterium]
MVSVLLTIAGIVLALVSGAAAGYVYHRLLVKAKLGSVGEKMSRVEEEALKAAEAKAKEIVLSAKEEAHNIVGKSEREFRRKQSELDKLQHRLTSREETLDKKLEQAEKKANELRESEERLRERQETADGLIQEQRKKLEEISGMSSADARNYLLKMMEKELKQEYAAMLKDYSERAKQESKRRAQHLVTMAIQQCAVDHVAESTVSVVQLASDEMKGRIIGREGRNIRAFETLTGVDLVVDDTPEAVVISAFDPIRREVARLALERLVSDGRIHPARIEEVIVRTREELEARTVEEGEKVAVEMKMTDIHPELIKMLGRLKYRTSYGQNVLMHSIEVAHLAGAMAAELDVSAQLAKRGGLLHDIGKAVDFEVEGPHALIGADLARRYRESRGIVHIIESHHQDVEQQTLEAVLVQAADAVSGSRPGARREDLESYVKRLTRLEDLAQEFEGVERAYAIQAGREIRIMVKPDTVDDEAMIVVARQIAKKIESDLSYPGQIKVNVIRETRAVEYAK